MIRFTAVQRTMDKQVWTRETSSLLIRLMLIFSIHRQERGQMSITADLTNSLTTKQA